jgi:hypothetical protein
MFDVTQVVVNLNDDLMVLFEWDAGALREVDYTLSRRPDHRQTSDLYAFTRGTETRPAEPIGRFIV